MKDALERYPDIMKAIEKTKLNIEAINAKRFKAGSWFASVPENPKPHSTIAIENMMKWDKLQADLKKYQEQIDTVDEFIASCPEPYKSIVKDRYDRRISNLVISSVYGISVRKMQRDINSLIDKFIEET